MFPPGFKVATVLFIFIVYNSLSSYYFFVNLGLDIGGDMKWEIHISLPSAGAVHNIIWVGFSKATQASGLYDCLLENIIACLCGPG